MAKQYTELSNELTDFIKQQKIYFVATATAESKINLSPKGMDSLQILNNNRLIWLNVTGSGNETAAHIHENPRMTIMFTAFEGKPMILRLYGKAKVIHPYDKEWEELYPLFKPLPAARQIFDLTIDLVQTSCGASIPFFDYVEEREQLNEHHTKIGEEAVQQYWHDRNQVSLDGKPTHIMQKNI